MEYITIIEFAVEGNHECANVGTIGVGCGIDLDSKFKEAMEAHFDAEIGYSFVDENIEGLTCCINGKPIDVNVELDMNIRILQHTNPRHHGKAAI